MWMIDSPKMKILFFKRGIAIDIVPSAIQLLESPVIKMVVNANAAQRKLSLDQSVVLRRLFVPPKCPPPSCTNLSAATNTKKRDTQPRRVRRSNCVPRRCLPLVIISSLSFVKNHSSLSLSLPWAKAMRIETKLLCCLCRSSVLEPALNNQHPPSAVPWSMCVTWRWPSYQSFRVYLSSNLSRCMWSVLALTATYPPLIVNDWPFCLLSQQLLLSAIARYFRHHT